MEMCDQQRLESLEEKKGGAHLCRHGIRRICKLYTKGPYRPANSRDANPLVTIWIIVDETTYKDPAPKTLD